MTKNGAAQPSNYSTALQLYYRKNVYICRHEYTQEIAYIFKTQFILARQFGGRA